MLNVYLRKEEGPGTWVGPEPKAAFLCACMQPRQTKLSSKPLLAPAASPTVVGMHYFPSWRKQACTLCVFLSVAISEGRLD